MRKLLIGLGCVGALALTPAALAANEAPDSHSDAHETSTSDTSDHGAAEDGHGTEAPVELVRPESQVGVVDGSVPVKAAVVVGGVLLLGIAVVGFSGGGRGPEPAVEISGDSHH